MSVPDNSRPKAPPSLLADGPGKAASAPANGGAPNGSRILANLEGRVVPPAAAAGKPRASKTAALVALLVIGAGAFGAWQLMTRAPSTASSASAAPASAAVVAAASASQPVVASAQIGAPDAASASHAATIIADDDAASAKSAAGNAAPAPANDADRLSRALTVGARDGNASGATVAAAAPKAQAPRAQSAPSREKAAAKHPAANTRRTESKSAVAQSKKPHNGAKQDDSDVDLLAVLVARTKPADAKAAAHGSKAAGKAQSDSNAPLAQQVKACGDRGFFEDQLCRWRVCDGHWGTDPACPSAARASNEH
ncbi:hypothetical protein ACFSHT_30400 [Paraburkholderia silviterrae]|uniref:Tail fiber protein n=1 Tax=Paraburkholderia silviterrae TaxID=2528715 RepID=A0A4R5LZR0_9BURK|nr:hypothetical protein [Paraburkholderia silviterrae]TDG18123.1 hypothetical protein EYW47_35745 [Paraburkholderia silviterrae]